jgi:uncharacterized protein YkwD
MRIVVTLALAVLLAGCAVTGSYVGEFRNPHASRIPPTPKQVATALETRVFVLVEHERLKIDPKAKPLKLDEELADVARAHSQDMAEKNYVAHASPVGETTATIIMAKDAKFQGLLGENIASQYYDRNADTDADELAQRFVDSWLGSADHKANLAYAPYDRSGVGVAVGGSTIYVTQLFATDLGLPPRPDTPPDAAEPPPPPAAAVVRPPADAARP